MNLSYSVDWKELKDFFRSAGKIVRADIQTGSDGRSRGNGIVVFETVGDAQNAVDRFNGYEWHGRRIELREDKFAREGGRGGNGRDDRRGGGDDYRGDGDRGRRERRRSDDYDDKPSRAPRNASPRARNPFTDDAQSSETPSASIMVRNLPWATTNDDLLDLFTTTGTVERAEIAYDRTNRPAGTAVVQFASTEHAQQTIAKLDGYNYGNRPLMLTYASYGDDVAPAAGLADGEDNAMTGVDDGATPAIPNGAGDITASSIQIANVSDEPAQPIEPPVPASDGDDLDVPMPAV
ncbi:g-strand binding protein [Savitreella phatthalungensis]